MTESSEEQEQLAESTEAGTLREEFARRNSAEWSAAITCAFASAPPRSAQWTDLPGIVAVLKPFMGPALNHTMLPGRGGMDFKSVADSPQHGCLELSPGDRIAHICKPAILSFEHFPESPSDSFLLLETEPLQPSGVYDDDSEYEELVELAPGEYIDRSALDTNVITVDENGEDIPLPATARLVVRHLRGKFLIVAKGSIWNRVRDTYDGRHNRMTAAEIRAQIQCVIDRGQSLAKHMQVKS